MWKLGKHCPFQAVGEIVKLPINREKKEIFLVNRVAISSGGEMLGLQLSDGCLWLRGVSVPSCRRRAGHGCRLGVAGLGAAGWV